MKLFQHSSTTKRDQWQPMLNADDYGLNKDNHKASPFQDVAHDINDTHEFEDNEIQLNCTSYFPRDEEIVDQELQHFLNEDAELNDEPGRRRLFTILCVEFVSAVKPKKKLGRSHIIGSPIPNNNNTDADDDGGMYCK